MKSTLSRSLLTLLSPQGAKGKLSILLFHKIPRVADPLTPDEMCLDSFEQILDFLQDNMQVLPLGEATAALKRGKLPGRAVALTFDDGYTDWLDTVAPALRKRDMHGSFFVTTEQINGPALWHERIVAAVRALPATNVALPYGFGSYADLSQRESRIRLVGELQERLKYAPLPDRMRAIGQLEAQAISPLILPPHFDAAAVRNLHAHGFEIGAHTQRHPILKECTHAEAMEEIGGSREQLAHIIGAPVTLFAYPNGRPQKDYAIEHVRLVKACGYSAALATSNGAATCASDLFQLPRFAPWEHEPTRLTYQLARNMLARDVRVRAHTDADAAATTPVRAMLIASTFPPIHGGSAVVYENLCLHMPPGSVRVLAAKRNYLNNREIEGWQQHDAEVDYPIDRIDFLRPLMLPAPANILVSAWRLVFSDLALYARTLITTAWLVRLHRINTICVGELVTGSWLGLAMRKLFGCKVIIYVHGEEITTVTGGRLAGNRRAQYLQAADKVVAVSSFTCDALTHMMGMRPEKIALIHNGVDTVRFTPGPPSAHLIGKHGLQGKRIIVSVGRLVTRKGIDMAIRAVGKLVREMPELRYLIVGDGECRAELEQLIHDEGLAKFVTLVGKTSDEDLLGYLRTCELFLLPNRTMPNGDTEGFGLVFREANACNKPVIGGRAGGVVEAVVEGVSGLLVDGTDVDAIAGAIRAILDDPALAARLSAGGLQLAQDNNTKAVADQFLKVCERVLHHSPV
jgi:glycosyltransferase involved in cell wall biosynthesis/peptidoglycan/xylan/chitin deacetylase (PgdA/CDA1 family)